MDLDLSPDQAVQAQVYLRAMAAAVEEAAHSADAQQRRDQWVAYAEVEGKLHKLIPPFADAPVDPGPYTPES